MQTPKRRKSDDTTRKLIDIESKERLSSRSIGTLSNQPELLKEYLESSISNTFSELMFRLTHEIYTEDKAEKLWNDISAHRECLIDKLDRDVGMLVAALDYLSNISRDILNPKIMDDLRIEEAAYKATRDSLTGLYLRGVFEFSLERLIQQHNNENQPLCIALLDIDDFKHVNDKYGHQTGDKVLHDIGTLLLKGARDGDLTARYGGEELAIIFPQTLLDDAIVIADRLRKRIQKHFSAKGPQVTASIGVSGIRASAVTNARQLIRCADKALYKAKSSGKNRVIGSARQCTEPDV